MDTLFADYENMLIGNQKDIGLYNFYGASPGGANQQRALTLIRYVLEELLGWDMEEVIKKFDSYIIHEMRLERVTDFIKYPVEVPDRDPRYILSLLYPERIHLNYTAMVIDVYSKVLEDKGQFPREYFAGVDGYYRFCICLQYLISNYKPCTSLDELYSFILSSAGNKFLMRYRLKVPANQFNINILDCIREITKEEENCDLYYYYYNFLVQLKAAYMPDTIPGVCYLPI